MKITLPKFISTALLLCANNLMGTVLLSGDVLSSSYSLRPFRSESTKSHSALGLGIGAVYKSGKYLDLRAFSDFEYEPLNSWNPGSPGFVTVGGESSILFAGCIPLGVRVGQRYMTDSDPASPANGSSNGFYVGFFIGSNYEANKKNFLKVRFQVSQTYLPKLIDKLDLETPKKGILDQVSLVVGWDRMVAEDRLVQSFIFNSIL